MIVLVLSACPSGLRGYLTRSLMEISAGVFVGHTSSRVREQLWDRVQEMVRNGRALMVYTTRTEQRFSVRQHGHHWQPEDIEGITLMRRPAGATDADPRPPGNGWSNAGRRRRFGARK